jgi:hypothetical protein
VVNFELRRFIVGLVSYADERVTSKCGPLEADRRRRQAPNDVSTVIVGVAGFSVLFSERLFESVKKVRVRVSRFQKNGVDSDKDARQFVISRE